MPARHIVTSIELNPKIIEGLLSAPEIERYELSVEERLVEGTVDFYKPIRKLFLATGLEQMPQVQKAIAVLKQDWQAFGTLLSESVSLSQAFQYPLTTLPLSIATPEGRLRQAPKHPFAIF